MIDQVPALCGNANEVRDALLLDDGQCLTGIPLVHDDELEASHETAEHHRHATSHVEKRHDEDERCIEDRIIRVDWLWIRCKCKNTVTTSECHERADHCAVRADSTLRATSGSRGVQDGAIVIRINVHHEHAEAALDFLCPLINVRTNFGLWTNCQHLDAECAA